MPAVSDSPLILKNTRSQKKFISARENKSYLFSANPVADAFVWGGFGAAAGAGVGVYNQRKLLKNKPRLDSAIDGIKRQIEEYKKHNKSVKKLNYSLKCLQNKKINWNSVKNWALAIGVITLLPQLICNTLMWIGKKGYDKITGSTEKE